ncbi:MAG: hypothetical protein ABSF44_09225 [Candidatus Bathyarchaeia archaeon]|jgi:cell division septation protein DedD
MKRLLTAFAMILLFSGILIACVARLGAAESGTVFNGIISSNTIWNAAGSPYSFNGPVAVAPGTTLAIEPGVIVNMNNYYFQVNGTLVAQGTNTNPITFNCNFPARPTFLTSPTQISSYISFNQLSYIKDFLGSGSIIQNAILNCNVYIYNVTVKIDQDTIWGIECHGGSSTVSNSQITGGLGIMGGSPTVSGNHISGGSGIYWVGRDDDRDNDVVAIEDESSPLINNNVITGNAVGIGFDAGDDGSNNNYNAVITGNLIYGGIVGIAIGGGTGQVLISDNTIYYCTTGISTYDSGAGGIQNDNTVAATIERNLISNATNGIQIATANSIQDNTITNNTVGIIASSPSTILYNNIQGNMQSVSLASANNLNATYNWWGTTDTQTINQTIHDSKNNFNLGTVDFVPLLNSPNARATPNISHTAPTPTASPVGPTPTPPLVSTSTNATPNTTPTPTPTPTSSENPVTSNPTYSEIYVILIVLLVVFATAFVAVMAILMRERRRSSHL